MFLCSVTIPSLAQNLPLHHKTLMTEFKIEYQIRRDSEGKESVHKVYLPSTYKGWAITAERKDAASPGAEAFPSEIPVGDLQFRQKSNPPTII